MVARKRHPVMSSTKGIVFVVDDDEDLLESVEDVLEDEGFVVLGARSGEEALARMRGVSGPCAAIVDLMMPEMSGWELVQAMKADPTLAQIPIITCSAHKVERIYPDHQHLRKPLHTQTLVAAVTSSLGRVK